MTRFSSRWTRCATTWRATLLTKGGRRIWPQCCLAGLGRSAIRRAISLTPRATPSSPGICLRLLRPARIRDGHLPAVFDVMRRRAPVLAIICSDHGTAYGEDEYFGHRVSHPVVWTSRVLKTPCAERLAAAPRAAATSATFIWMS